MFGFVVFDFKMPQIMFSSLLITGMNDRRCAFIRGRGIGGTSIINYMIYSRGHQSDFDRWSAAGNNGWSYKDVLPYFLKSERSTLQNLRDSSNHNSDGELSVEYNRFKTKIAEDFVGANKFLGQQEIDYNSGDNLGVSYVQTNSLHGKRHSAYRAFIEPILDRPNLHIMLNSQVTKVIIDPDTKTASGVELVRFKRSMRFDATKEVILAAGAFHSPQLLMLSGVGVKEDLEKHGITSIYELPVGKTMFDHVFHFGLTFIFNTTGNSFNLHELLSSQTFFDYLNGQGPLTVNRGGEALSFIRTKYATSEAPDIEILSTAASLHSDFSQTLRALNIKKEIYEKNYKPLIANNVDTFTALIVLLHPKSVGQLELQNSDPMSPPKFMPNYLQHPDDVETMLEGVKFALKLLETPQFQMHGARLNPIPLSSCTGVEFASDDYWRCSIRTMSSSFHDQAGTCKMGPATDETAVVSPELKVHGIDRLRIVDTSVIPESSSGHLSALSYMIGEKAANMMKAEWGHDIVKTKSVGTMYQLKMPILGYLPTFNKVSTKDQIGSQESNFLKPPHMNKDATEAPDLGSTYFEAPNESPDEQAISSGPLNMEPKEPEQEEQNFTEDSNKDQGSTEAPSKVLAMMVNSMSYQDEFLLPNISKVSEEDDDGLEFIRYPDDDSSTEVDNEPNDVKLVDEIGSNDENAGEILLTDDDIRRKRKSFGSYL